MPKGKTQIHKYSLLDKSHLRKQNKGEVQRKKKKINPDARNKAIKRKNSYLKEMQRIILYNLT